MSYVLKDGTHSSQYIEGDKFVYCGEKGDHEVFSEGEVLTLHWDDESRCPEFKEDSTEETGYTYWSDLKAYKVDTEENDKSMKLERMDYVNVEDFTLEELLILEGLIKEQGYFTLEEVNDHHQTNCLHYGVDNNGHTMFYDLWYTNNGGRNVSEQFRKYLDSLSQESNESVEEDTKVTDTIDNLSIKDRLLALVDGEILEWLYVFEYDKTNNWILFESFYFVFGDVIYDETLKVRVKPEPEKDHLILAFEEYCTSLELPSDFTSNLFKYFKAGYDAAKEND